MGSARNPVLRRNGADMSRLVHRSVALALSLSLLGAATASAGVVPPFSDIDGHRFEADIEWMRLAGLTEGCGGGQFCPDAPVTRGQMASFLVRALALPATSINAFTDDDGLANEDAINRLAAAGITTGCAPTRFCPAANVTRVEMATFLARGFDLPLATRDWFGDDDGYVHQTNVNRLAESGITSGCGHSRFCPSDLVTRGQMAAFLHRALTSAGPPEACTLFPATNVWNKRVDALPLASNSGTMIATIGRTEDLHPDFGEYLGYGIPINVVGSSTPRSTVTFDYDDESDHVSYPIPPGPRIEGGSDRHILMWDVDACRLYELFAAERSRRALGCRHRARPGTCARTPCGPTAGRAQTPPVCRSSPASCATRRSPPGRSVTPFASPRRRLATRISIRHDTTRALETVPTLPPMGLRVRLKADFNIGGFGPQARVILVAMKRYGMILADNGSPWFFSGSSDIRWDDDQLNDLKSLRGSDFEVVNTSGFVSGP